MPNSVHPRARNALFRVNLMLVGAVVGAAVGVWRDEVADAAARAAGELVFYLPVRPIMGFVAGAVLGLVVPPIVLRLKKERN